MRTKPTYLVRIDADTWAFLRARATPFESRGKLVRRLLGVDTKQPKEKETKR